MKIEIKFSLFVAFICLFFGVSNVSALTTIHTEYNLVSNAEYGIPDFNHGRRTVGKGSMGYFPFITRITYSNDYDINGATLVHYVDFCYNGEMQTGTHTATELNGNTVTLYVTESGKCNSTFKRYSLKYVWNAVFEEYLSNSYGWLTAVTFNDVIVQDKTVSKYIGYIDPHTFVSNSPEETTYLHEIEQRKLQQQTNDKLDDMTNMDIDDSAKESPDDSSYKDYSTVEGEIKNIINKMDTSNLDIGIDASASKFTWDKMTSLIQSHSAVFGFFISILSIGIIKLMFGR